MVSEQRETFRRKDLSILLSSADLLSIRVVEAAAANHLTLRPLRRLRALFRHRRLQPPRDRPRKLRRRRRRLRRPRRRVVPLRRRRRGLRPRLRRRCACRAFCELGLCGGHRVFAAIVAGGVEGVPRAARGVQTPLPLPLPTSGRRRRRRMRRRRRRRLGAMLLLLSGCVRRRRRGTTTATAVTAAPVIALVAGVVVAVV